MPSCPNVVREFAMLAAEKTAELVELF